MPETPIETPESGPLITDPGPASGASGTAGTPLGSDFGNPHDRSRPPWSVYEDPAAAIDAANREAAQASDELRLGGEGALYRYDGPKAAGDGTQVLVTPHGTVRIDQEIRLSDAAVKELRDSGHRFSKLSDEQAAKVEEEQAPESTDETKAKKTTGNKS